MANANQKSKIAATSKVARKPKVADSWDDESSSDSDTNNKDQAPDRSDGLPAPSSRDDDSAPRTSHEADERPDLGEYINPYFTGPGSTTTSSSNPPSSSSSFGARITHGTAVVPDKRPEKTTATAQRMIASAIGVRVQRTEEQRAFQRAQLENEKRRREEERRRKEEEEKAKVAVWED